MYKISASTLFIGQNYLYLPSCHSTNDMATSYVLTDRAMEGFTIATSHQTAGRGQRGNSWEAAPDQNLTLSIVLKPEFLEANQQFHLNVAISLAIIDCLSEFVGEGLKIKWPNDIYFKNQKLGGILTENILKKNRIEYAVLGIGLNINQKSFSAPMATSLAKIRNKTYELTPILESVLEQLEKRYLQLRADKYTALKQEYLNLLYWFQETRQYEQMVPPDKGHLFEGEIIGVDAVGKLAISTNHGQRIRYFGFKEIRFVR